MRGVRTPDAGAPGVDSLGSILGGICGVTPYRGALTPDAPPALDGLGAGTRRQLQAPGERRSSASQPCIWAGARAAPSQSGLDRSSEC